VTGGWRKLHNGKLHKWYSSPSMIRMFKSRRMIRNEWREKRNAYRTLVGKPEGKRLLGRPRRRWVNNIKVDFRDMMGWYELN
jgi:hypothetical protein